MKINVGTQSGRWHYCIAGALPAPIGYCAQGCAGHETAAGAVEHWFKYIAASTAFYEPAQGMTINACDVPGCLNNSAGYARVDRIRVNLCDDHRDAEGAAATMPKFDDAASAQAGAGSAAPATGGPA